MSDYSNQWTVRLPSSATSFQVALAGVDAERLAAIDPEIISTLWDPYRCPLQLLPYLAWALSVDVWDDEWPEAVKRSVVAAAPEVHRRKGTVRAVRDALKPFGMTALLKEWWQQNPPERRGTFSVTVLINDLVFSGRDYFDARTQQLAFQAVTAAKPKSRVFDLKIAVGTQSDLSASNAASGVTGSVDIGFSSPFIPIQNGIGAANAFTGLTAQTFLCEVYR